MFGIQIRYSPSTISPRRRRVFQGVCAARRGVFLWGMVLLPALGNTHALAAPGKTAIMIAARTGQVASQRIIQAVWGQLSDVQVGFRVEWVDRFKPRMAEQLAVASQVAKKTAAVAVFWFDSAASTVYLFLAGPGGGRLVTRSVHKAGAEGRYEAVAIIVRSIVSARLQGAVLGVRLPPPPPARASRPVRARAARTPPEPRTPQACRPGRCRPGAARSCVDLELAYALDVISEKAAVVQGLRLAVAVNLHRHWYLFVGYRMEAPIHLAGRHASVTLQRHPLSLGTRFLWALGRFELGAQLALIVTMVTRRTDALAGGMVAFDASTDVLVAVTPQLYGAFRPAARLKLLLGIGAQVSARRTRYVADGPAGRETLLSPWPAGPSAMLGLSVNLF